MTYDWQPRPVRGCELAGGQLELFPGVQLERNLSVRKLLNVFSFSFQQPPSHFFRSDREFLYDIYINYKKGQYSEINGRAITHGRSFPSLVDEGSLSGESI